MYNVASSGYPTHCHVTASAKDHGELIIGTASCDVTYGDSLAEVVECLAIESMLAACELTLDNSKSHRNIIFSSNL